MMIQIKYKDKTRQYGSWLMLDQLDEVLKNAIQHNMPNLKYPVEDHLDEVFKNIIDELDYLNELKRGHTISEELIDITYEMLYHFNHGLMFEGTGRVTMYPRRVFLKE